MGVGVSYERGTRVCTSTEAVPERPALSCALRAGGCAHPLHVIFFFFVTLVTGPRRSLSLKLRDTRVYEPPLDPIAVALTPPSYWA